MHDPAEPTTGSPEAGSPETRSPEWVPPEFGPFDEFVSALGHWAGELPEWPPAAAVRASWQQVEPRLDRARRELSRVLVVGVVGGTGTGKSTLVNALAGGDVSAAGDVARPTTVNPVVVVANDVDLSWLPVEAMNARVVRSAAPAVANIVLVDCPDPDTQPDRVQDEGPARDGRPSAGNRNRDLLEQVLPACDVLVLVATAQKYKSWIVAREVATFAPGRPLFFVQTHAARDPDIRADWRRELDAQGFSVPRIFRLDGLEAARRSAAGLAPESGFAELVAAIDEELVGRAARRVRRTGALDLAGWFMRESASRLEPLAAASRGLATGVQEQRTRLEQILAKAVAATLRGQRHGWQRLVTAEIVDRWQGGPFALFLHALAALQSLWGRARTGGGIVGRLLAGGPVAVATGGPSGWQAVEELGLSEAEVEQSRSILAGLAARARIGDALVGRGRLDDARVQSLATTVLDRAGHWLAAGVERMAADRRQRLGGPLVHWAFEAAFAALLVAVLARAGWSFFYGYLWLGRATDGGGFLWQALVWLVIWGLVLRWLVGRLVQAGLDRDIATLVAGLPQARLVEPLLADYAEAATRVGDYLDEGDRLTAEADRLATTLAEPAAGLGRFQPS